MIDKKTMEKWQVPGKGKRMTRLKSCQHRKMMEKS